MATTTKELPLPEWFRDPDIREEIRARLRRFLQLPVALASLVLLLFAVMELMGSVNRQSEYQVTVLGWALWAFIAAEFLTQLLLASDKLRFLKANWLLAVVVVIPVLRVLTALRLISLTRGLLTARLALSGGRNSTAFIRILRRRHLGQLSLVSVGVVLMAAELVGISEIGVHGANIGNFGNALYWAAATLTTVGSNFYPTTTGGKVVAILLDMYGVAAFTYLAASLASVLVGSDRATGAAAQPSPSPPEAAGKEPASAEPQETPLSMMSLAEEIRSLSRALNELRATLQAHPAWPDARGENPPPPSGS
ncbi:MAG TPA: potassium channel family protein [Chloroflexota bacterium]|nr:potassium channel family protein [Chloroflexota bacterium]